MANDQKVLQQVLGRALSGKDSHIENASIFAGMSWELAGVQPDGVPHTLFELLNHMIYWQEWVVKWLDGKKPRPPKHAAGGWPGKTGPANQREWQRTVQRFRKALGALNRRSRQGDPLSKRGEMTRLEMLHIIGSHTSYHAGQVTFLRQLLAAWPPPSGGVTW